MLANPNANASSNANYDGSLIVIGKVSWDIMGMALGMTDAT